MKWEQQPSIKSWKVFLKLILKQETETMYYICKRNDRSYLVMYKTEPIRKGAPQPIDFVVANEFSSLDDALKFANS